MASIQDKGKIGLSLFEPSIYDFAKKYYLIASLNTELYCLKYANTKCNGDKHRRPRNLTNILVFVKEIRMFQKFMFCKDLLAMNLHSIPINEKSP